MFEVLRKGRRSQEHQIWSIRRPSRFNQDRTSGAQVTTFSAQGCNIRKVSTSQSDTTSSFQDFRSASVAQGYSPGAIQEGVSEGGIV